MVKEKTIYNKNASLRLSREQRTDARGKTHEQRKPKKKRKMNEDEHLMTLCTKPVSYWSEDIITGQKQPPKQVSDRCKHCQLGQRFFKRKRNIIRLGHIMQPRPKEVSCQIIPPVSQKVPENLLCYPVTGSSYAKPLVPAGNMSFPTQVSEQQESNTAEFLFSNGTSIKIDHGTNNQVPTDIQVPSVGSNSVGVTRHSGQQLEENHAQGQATRQYVFRRPPRPPRYPDYIEHHQRLKSYARWWKQHPDPTTLCNAGFFYTDKEDLVRCFYCGIGLKDFSYGDDPLKEHVKYSNDCAYLQEYLGQEGLENIKKQVQSEDMPHNQEEPSGTFASEYRHPEYMSYQVRLSSFSRWPRSLMQRPEQLAEAGLYYTGFEDIVRCFACDGGLRQWNPEDDPWLEHCRWFPECPFLKKEKGDEYIRLVQATAAREIKEQLDGEGTATNNNISNDVTSEMERLTLKDPQLNAVIDEHRITCLEMGYSEKDFNIAASKLAKIGSIKPTIEDILDVIESAEQTENEENLHENETPKEENIRLKKMLFCMTCGKNSVNALFLPCTHHRMCMSCAQQYTKCPVCERHIRQKIKTFLV